MPADFSTKEFTFDDGLLSLCRRAKIDRIPFDQITTIELKKGSDLKRPKLAIVFGVCLILFCTNILSAFNSGDIFVGGTVIRILAVLFTMGGIGVSAVYFAVPIHPIVEIQIGNEIERLSVSSLVKRGTLDAFSDFLRGQFGTKFKDNLIL